MNLLEIAANVFNAASIFLAARNSVHVWWTSIVGCTLFAWVFFGAKLYADVTLQGFFIVASAIGWWRWLHGAFGQELPVRYSPRSVDRVGNVCGRRRGGRLRLAAVSLYRCVCAVSRLDRARVQRRWAAAAGRATR